MHPDLNRGESSSDFCLINEAYQVLSNQNKRKDYDLWLMGGNFASRIYYRTGPVSNYHRAFYTAQKKKETEPPGILERVLDMFLFFSLIFLGLSAIFFGVFSFWQDPVEGVNRVNGIVVGVVFTALLAAGWVKWNKISG